MTCPLAPPRLRHADRNQLRLEPVDLDSLVDHDHRVRTVWMWVEKLDLSPVLNTLRARGSNPGRAATDPRILVCLWLYATTESVGSARLLADLCQQHNVYKWIMGGVSINHSTLSEFRVNHEEFLDGLLTNSMAALINQGVVDLKVVAQDGVRVRAAAGRSSFRRKETLAELQQQCEAHIKALKQELEQNPEAASARHKAARERAARERKERLDAALANLEQMEKKSEESRKKQRKKAGPDGEGNEGNSDSDANKKKPGPPRASTTDPEARRMKMANGGVDPAYNFQFVTEKETRLIVGVEVTNVGSDHGEMTPLNDQLFERYGRRAEAVLADGGYVDLEDITRMEKAGTRVYAPPKKPKEKKVSARTRRNDTPETKQWRERMETEEGQQLARQRGSVAELSNAQARNHGLRQLTVRGRKRVRAVALWHALAINVLRMEKLGVL